MRNINSRRRSRSELIFTPTRRHHALIVINHGKENLFDSNMKGNATLMQRFPKDYFAVNVDRSKCLHATTSNALFCTHYVGNVIYHKISLGDVSYRFNGKNVNLMLEFSIYITILSAQV